MTPRLAPAAAEVDARGGIGRAIACDHGDDDQIERLVEHVWRETGRIDLLVNNVWRAPEYSDAFGEPFWLRPMSDWDTLVGVGLRAHFVASSLAARKMVQQGSGAIVNISSFGAIVPMHSVLYGISKAALDKMALDMAHELRGHGVTTLSIWPGLVRTEAVIESGVDDIMGFPVAEAETPEFIGRVLLRLLSDPDISHMSGGTVVVSEAASAYGIRTEGGFQPASPREVFRSGPPFAVAVREDT